MNDDEITVHVDNNCNTQCSSSLDLRSTDVNSDEAFALKLQEQLNRGTIYKIKLY